MPYDHDYVCMMKEPVVCELCNKSYAIGRMKAHKQTHKQTKMYIQNAEKCGVPSPWWFMGGTKPNAFVGRYNKQLAQSTSQNPPAHPSAYPSANVAKLIAEGD